MDYGMRAVAVHPIDVEVIPEHLEDGVLYICERYQIALHRCCCGCGEEVVTPLTPAEWSLARHGKSVSLSPSIGNWSFKCRSHYWIRQNKVVWSGGMSDKQIQRVKESDREAKIAYVEATNRLKAAQGIPGFLGRCWAVLRHFLGL